MISFTFSIKFSDFKDDTDTNEMKSNIKNSKI